MVRNRDSNFEREIAVFSYPQAGVVTGSLKFIGNQTIFVFGLREELRPQIANISLQIAGILREKFESDGLSVKQASPLQYEAQLALVISLQDVPSSSVAGLHEVITSALNKF